MSDQSLELLESKAIDDSFRAGDKDHWAQFSAPKDLTIAEDSALDPQESPRSVATPEFDREKTSTNTNNNNNNNRDTRGISSANSLPNTNNNHHHHQHHKGHQPGKSVRRSPPNNNTRDKVKIKASARRELALDSMEEIPNSSGSGNSRRSEMEESRRQRSGRSHNNNMDESRSRRRSDKDHEMDDSRQRNNNNRMDESSGKRDSHRRRGTESGRPRNRPSSSRTLEARLQGERHPAGASERSMDGSSSRDHHHHHRDRSPKRSGTGRPRTRAPGSSGRGLHSSGDSVHSNPREGEDDHSHADHRERRPRSSRTAMNDDSGGAGARLRRTGTAKDPSLKRQGTRTRRAGDPGARMRSSENGKKLGDGSDPGRERGDRRMSDGSKNRQRKEGRRNSAEESGRRSSDRAKKEKRGSMEESSRRRRRDGERRSRRERVRGKETYIPPPSKGEGGEDEEDMPPHHRSSGPNDVAPSEKRRSSRQNKRSPLDMPPMEDDESESEEEQIFETTWQRSAPGRGARGRRSLMGDAMGISPQLSRRSLLVPGTQNAPSPAAQARRPGRDRRGANVRQSQLVNMVLLHEEEMEQTDDNNQGTEHLEGLEEEPEGEEEQEEEAKPDLDMTVSEHKEHKRSLAKVAAKASSAMSKASARAAGEGAKAAGKAAEAGAKAAMSGAKGATKASLSAAKGAARVLGFRKKKKPLAYAEGEHSTVGLVLEEHDDLDLDPMAAWDTESQSLHGSGGTNLNDSGTSLKH